MQFTLEQYNKEIGDYPFDDLPFNLTKEACFKFFNLLPVKIQADALKWGITDTVVRETIFKYVCKNQFDMSIEEYYISEIASKYFKYDTMLTLDFSKMENNSCSA